MAQNKNTEKEGRKFEIRTMEKDLRRLLAARLGKAPEEIIIEQLPFGEKDQPETKLDLFIEKYLKIVFLVLLAFAFLAVVAGFFWLRHKKSVETPVIYHTICEKEQCKIINEEGEDECKKDEDCKTTALPPSPPSPLLPVSIQETLILKNTGPDEFSSMISESLKKIRPANTIRPIFLAIGTNSTPQKYLELSEATRSLNVFIPATILPYIQDYNLFLYTAGQKEKSSCDGNGISDPRCWGPRMVLVLRLAKTDDITSKLHAWEKTMIQDLNALILAQSNEVSQEFQDFFYKGQLVRYKNLETSTITVNYTIINDLLIIGTSKESISSALDTLLQP